LRIIGAASPETRRLSTRLAAVLEWSGRGGEAALVYLDAARGAPARERVELERAAAEQLLACGRIDEGVLVLRGVLASMGMSAPKTLLGALVSMLAHRAWLFLVGLRFRDRASADVSREDRVRVDSLYSIALGLSMVDVVLAAAMHSRHILLALRVGDRNQVVRAASLEAAQLASMGGPITGRELSAMEVAGRLVERGSDTEGDAFLRGSHAIGLFLRGRWRDAHRLLDASYEKYPNHKAGWHANAKLFAVYALFYVGDLPGMKRRAVQLLAEAEQRNDFYIVVNLRTTSMVDIELAADDPEAARAHIRQAMELWSMSGFLVQHWKAMVWAAEIELYAGEGVRACEILERDRRALARSFLLHVQYLRAATGFVRARALVASIHGANARRAASLREARRIGRRLEREGMAWTAAIASLVLAAVENAAGDRAAAMESLELAIHRCVVADMSVHAAVARQRLGLLIGGAEGDRRVRDADDALSAQGIVAPARYAGMVLPGRWTAGPPDEER
ncbi:MAG TPA: hypothetical protein VK762_09870, partial [Polyangiaceae bacterium]|nr:hypothetical protein [Polyangiaceae bacterium]